MGASFIEAIITIFVELGIPWTPMTAKILVAVGALFLFPFFLRNIRISQARNLLKRSNVVYGVERRNMEEQAIEKVKDIPTAMMGLADQAIVMKRFVLAEELISFVPQNKKYKRELLQIQRKINPVKNRNLPSEILAIEQAIENEVYGLAQSRLKEAKEQWPNSQKLEALEAILTQIMVQESD